MQVIHSRENNNIKLINKLINYKKYRDNYAKAVLIGEHLIVEFIPTNQIECVFINEEKQDKYCNLISKLFENSIQVVFVMAEIYNSITSLDADICAIITTTKEDISASSLMHTQDCVVLEAIQDPGNLGAILRVAAASGIKNVLISSNSVDLYNPKVLRASQGCLTYLNIFTNIDIVDFLAKYQSQVILTTPHAKTSMYDIDLTNPSAWVYGNEGSGISHELLDNNKFIAATIPMKGQIESMNIATAVAVCLFEQVRQKGYKK